MRCGAGSLQTEPTSQPTCSTSPPSVLDLGENGKRSCFAGEHGVRGSRESARHRAVCIRSQAQGCLGHACVHTHGPHAATLTSKRAVPSPEPRLCGAQEAMPMSVTTLRFMACHIIIREGGDKPLRYIPACAH